MESGLLLVVSVVAAGLVDIWLPRLELAVIVRWVVIVALIMGFLAILGQRVCGRFDGILILNRYRISLSRRQLTLYASIVWSALFAQETRLSHLALAPPRSPAPVITNNKKQTVSSRKPQLLQEQRLQAARPASSSAGRGRRTSDGLRVNGSCQLSRKHAIIWRYQSNANGAFLPGADSSSGALLRPENG